MEKKINTQYIVWLLPLSYFLHILEEYFGGIGLPRWLSAFINADISNADFILINSIALSLVIAYAIIHTYFLPNKVMLLGLTCLFFLNGIIHLLSGMISMSYSPGTVTGVFLYLPVGAFIYKQMMPLLSRWERALGISLGIMIHLVVIIIAINI